MTPLLTWREAASWSALAIGLLWLVIAAALSFAGSA